MRKIIKELDDLRERIGKKQDSDCRHELIMLCSLVTHGLLTLEEQNKTTKSLARHAASAVITLGKMAGITTD